MCLRPCPQCPTRGALSRRAEPEADRAAASHQGPSNYLPNWAPESQKCRNRLSMPGWPLGHQVWFLHSSPLAELKDPQSTLSAMTTGIKGGLAWIKVETPWLSPSLLPQPRWEQGRKRCYVHPDTGIHAWGSNWHASKIKHWWLPPEKDISYLSIFQHESIWTPTKQIIFFFG